MNREDSNKGTEETKVALMQQQINYIQEKVDSIDLKLDDKYVTKDEFKPIKMLVYGSAGIILTSVFTAVVYLVLK